MATLKATHITNFDAKPPLTVNSRLHGGNVKGYVDAFEIGDTDNADVTVVFKVGIDEIATSLVYAHDDLTSGTLEVGLYKKNNDGTYTAVDADCFATALALGSGAVAPTEILFEAGATNIADARETMWEKAGLTTRPDYAELYIALTHTVGTGADGTFYMKLETIG